MIEYYTDVGEVRPSRHGNMLGIPFLNQSENIQATLFRSLHHSALNHVAQPNKTLGPRFLSPCQYILLGLDGVAHEVAVNPCHPECSIDDDMINERRGTQAKGNTVAQNVQRQRALNRSRS